jgi:hypothetical protein
MRDFARFLPPYRSMPMLEIDVQLGKDNTHAHTKLHLVYIHTHANCFIRI